MAVVPVDAERAPAADVAAEVQVLNLIYQAQLKQEALLEGIRAQQAQVSPSLSPGAGVKIIDFNMPFFALVGLLVKIALASIPAAIVLSVIYGIVAFVVIFGLSVLGIGLSALG